MWDEWDKAWTDSRIEPKELLDLGDRLLILHTFVARGRRSGAEVRQPAGQLHTIRDGRAVRWEQWCAVPLAPPRLRSTEFAEQSRCPCTSWRLRAA